jgi:short-subunit dehydrogenase
MKDASAHVTGATAGIGYEISRGFARGGMSVVITGRDEKRGRAAAAELRQETKNDSVEFIAVDHSTIGANQQLAEHLGERLDHLDVLVNNVGRVFSRREETADGYEASLALNFLAPFALTGRLCLWGVKTRVGARETAICTRNAILAPHSA